MFLVTGGSSGIGRALAWELARRGKSVLIVGRRKEKLSEASRFSPLISTCCADVSTMEGRTDIIASLAEVSRLQGVVHNAGIIEPIVPLESVDEYSWQKILATNLSAPLFLSQELLPRLRDGKVLHIGSGAAYFPVSGWAGYCVSKAALAMLTRCWQLESEKTSFASVMPGIIDTDMQAVIRQSRFMEQEKKDFFNRLYNEKKLISPETVAHFLAWLLLDVDHETFRSREWDIYDKNHHQAWLPESSGVPEWED
ncbi:SDR family NAD(P)-dependent oxidoreductase [Legionella spiritensis]|uniref:SDR family NAD(P)-dependent oxidoreductase n=1 Tax=Legionella spiritensis TaxID=452 RepID=UPI000F71138F|nr:SDR family NAD(P)-dependent oxidoreductase [Legionella spiritensis]VEG92418.1 sepiapterin reductase [Legionella spiritensis]